LHPRHDPGTKALSAGAKACAKRPKRAFGLQEEKEETGSGAQGSVSQGLTGVPPPTTIKFLAIANG